MSADFDYGIKQDIQRLVECCLMGGQFSCKLNKMPNGHLCGVEDFQACDINHPLASTITARYYKGISAHKDNMVIEIWKIEEPNA